MRIDRPHDVRVRLSDEELEEIRFLAAAWRVSLPECFRRLSAEAYRFSRPSRSA